MELNAADSRPLRSSVVGRSREKEKKEEEQRGQVGPTPSRTAHPRGAKKSSREKNRQGCTVVLPTELEALPSLSQLPQAD